MPVKLHYNIFGEGKPVIVLHGLFGSSRNWQSVAKTLSLNFQIITPDLRNHGQSFHAESMTYTEMSEDVLELIKINSLDNVSLIGHSMGGKVAMINALLHSHVIEKLAVLDIAPISYEHRYGKLFQAMNNLPLDNIKSRNEAEKILNDQINDIFLTRFLLQNLARTDNGFEWRLNLPAIQSNIEYISSFPDIGPDTQYEKPALFLGGEKSHFVQPQYHEKIKKYFPNADIELIENAGHMLHIEQPDKTVSKLRKFLES
jgi:pimeloyl-ACP methyl ester carboxylesterase